MIQSLADKIAATVFTLLWTILYIVYNYCRAIEMYETDKHLMTAIFKFLLMVTTVSSVPTVILYYVWRIV